jgi:hypothetical protein
LPEIPSRASQKPEIELNIGILLGKQSPNKILTKSNINDTSVMARHFFASFSPRRRPDWEPVSKVLVVFAFKPDRAYQLTYTQPPLELGVAKTGLVQIGNL